MIGFQCLGKQTATVKCVFAQHALAPTVNGRDSSLIHPLGRNIQTICATGPLLGRVLFAQLGDQAIGCRCFIAEKPGGLSQPCTNALSQLFGGGIGEGHHEDLRRQKLTPETAGLRAMAKNQAQVKRRNSERLACPGAGLDQLTATQRERKGKRWLSTHERASSVDKERHGASSKGR
ncbi:hypothetical protein D3C85_1014380 [compost metagenome]